MVFTHHDPIEGKIGIGRLPFYMYPILQNISNNFLIPNPYASTYHVYYTALEPHVKTLFDKIQYDTLWDSIYSKSQWGYLIESMNEIYYSNPRPRFERTHLYGASANLVPHRDCVLFYFPFIEFYRVIIGVYGWNNDTSTIFTNLNLEHKMNQGDYMIFDFDKTTHQVVKTGDYPTPRVLLKLHFILCNKEFYSSTQYVQLVSYFYQTYYLFARYTEQIGTDPTTFIGFFYGLAWELPFYTSFKYILIGTYTGLAYYHRNMGHKGFIIPLYYMMIAYLTLVTFHWYFRP